MLLLINILPRVTQVKHIRPSNSSSKTHWAAAPTLKLLMFFLDLEEPSLKLLRLSKLQVELKTV